MEVGILRQVKMVSKVSMIPSLGKEQEMSIHKTTPKIMIVIGMLLIAASGVLIASPTSASAEDSPTYTGATLPYSGRLSLASGGVVADGSYDFALSLYGAHTGGEALWSETQEGVAVRAGVFNLSLGNLNPIPVTALDGTERWLEIAVRGPGETSFSTLQPRQQLSSVQASTPAGTTSLSCAHNHFGETWKGTGWYGLEVETTGGNLEGAVYGRTDSLGFGLYGEAVGASSNNAGVYGTSNSSIGYGGQFNNSSGGTSLYAENSSGGDALHTLNNSSGDSIYAVNNGSGNAIHAVGHGAGNTNAALRVENANGVAAYLTSNTGNPTLEIDKTNPGGAAIDLQLFNPGNEDPAMFIKGYDQNVTLQFLISTLGIVMAHGYITMASDMAEMLLAEDGLEAGDVLAIGADGKLMLTTAPYQTSVAGIYSTNPGFTGGHPLEGETPGKIPLAVVGVVPVKVSAENGAIQPGDLLVSSSTPGYAMRAGDNPPQGTVIGKALEALEEGLGVIQVLATLQ
jgi:hypothetical protein